MIIKITIHSTALTCCNDCLGVIQAKLQLILLQNEHGHQLVPSMHLEMFARLAKAGSAFNRLNRLWADKHVSVQVRCSV